MGDLCIVCKEIAVVKCGGCGKILYCCEEHKKNNASSHKTECRPYSVEDNSKFGRYLVTCRPVKQGELLLRERPLLVGPRVDSLPACLECLSLLTTPSERCQTCHVASLCPQCPHNPLECQFYASLTPANKTLCLESSRQHVLPLRIILNLKSPQGDASYKRILDMESHMKEREGTSVWFSHQKNVLQLLRLCGVVSCSADDERLVQHVCGVLDINSFEVRGAMGLAGRGMRLRGVYADAALMAHDCLGNVHLAVDDNFVMTIRASVDIPEGQPILYNYTDPLKPTQERQSHLREGKYFSCSCLRCEDPSELGTHMGAVWCPRCRTGIVSAAAAGNWACSSCGHSSLPGLMTITTNLGRERLEDVDRTDPEQLEQVLKQLSYTFHPAHSVMIDIKQSIIAAYRELQPTKNNLSRKIELCKELLPIITIIEPGISRLRGITLYELHMSLVTLAQLLGGEGGDAMREAETVLKEAVSLLLYEPTASPEGELARQAIAELKALQNMIGKDEKKKKKKNKDKNKK